MLGDRPGNLPLSLTAIKVMLELPNLGTHVHSHGPPLRFLLATELWELCVPTCVFHEFFQWCISVVLPVSKWGISGMDEFTTQSVYTVASVAQGSRLRGGGGGTWMTL